MSEEAPIDVAEARAREQIAEDLVKFLRSRAGRKITSNIEKARTKFIEKLCTVDPNDSKLIWQIQNRIFVYDKFCILLSEAAVDGANATAELEALSVAEASEETGSSPL